MSNEENPTDLEEILQLPEPQSSVVTDADLDAADFAAIGIGGPATASRRNFRLVAGFVSRDAPVTPEMVQALRDTVMSNSKDDITIFRIANARREIARLARYAEMMDTCEDNLMRLAQKDDATMSELLRATEYISKRYEAIRESLDEITKLPPITISVNQDNRSTTNIMGTAGIDLTQKSSRENIRNFFKGASKQLETISRGEIPLSQEQVAILAAKRPDEGEA